MSFKVGDKVKVKREIVPTTGWGSINEDSIGVIKVIGQSILIDFPEQKEWIGLFSEIELYDNARIIYQQIVSRIK
ncbi:MAG: hypothetical protein PF569_02395 [Candidatus Woesearchaeota archaeon]|jgi:hypothetical protein|nr:hypothetical protein [Candidatus Woesearchaeota archaeon]